MTPAQQSIRNTIDLCSVMKSNAEKRIREERLKCTHSKGIGKYGANTGNYDPSCDCYWITFTCSICDNVEHVDSERDKDRYYELSRSGMTQR